MMRGGGRDEGGGLVIVGGIVEVFVIASHVT